MTWPASIPTATPGAAATAADFNALRDALNAIGNAWTVYTPVLTASTTDPTLGSGMGVGGYVQAGKLVLFRATITFGSGMTAGSGTYWVSLPVTVSATMPLHAPIGRATFFDTSAPNVYVRSATLRTTGGTQIIIRDTSGAAMTHASPVAPASGDQISVMGFYEGV